MWFLILFLVLFFPVTSFSEEDILLIGEVSSINIEKKEISLLIKEDCQKNLETIERILKIIDGNRIIQITIKEDDILNKISQGDILRIWVSYDDNTRNFVANTITKPGRFLGGRDQTGIRRRLERIDSNNLNMRKRHGR